MKIYCFKIHLLNFCKCFTTVNVMFMVCWLVKLLNATNIQYNLVYNCQIVILGMGDVLPPKRQTVVDRLRVRLERYRWHHNSCVPRYERSAGALCDKERQDTVRLKQRFLESKAKKAKSNKSDHHRTLVSTRASTPDAQKFHSKATKTVAEESPINTTAESSAQNAKASGNDARGDNASAKTAAEDVQSTMPGFSLSVTPQFTNSKSNVQPSPSVQNENSSKSTLQLVAANETNHSLPIEAKSDVHCKQEDGKNFDLCQLKSSTPSSISGDRLSDTFPSIGFAEDATEDVIHPDILKHLIDDVFTNPVDIMKDFSFDDSIGSIKEGERSVSESGKASTSVSPLQKFNSDMLMFSNHTEHSVPQQGSSLFDTHSSKASSSGISSLVTSSSSSVDSAYCGSHQVQSAHCGVNNLHTNVPAAFKLTEPSPAALTLKQMAEQYQNVEQKLTSGVNPTLSMRTEIQLDKNYLLGSMPTFRSRFLSGPTQHTQSVATYQPYDSGYFKGLTALVNNNPGQKTYRPNNRHIASVNPKYNLLQPQQQHSFGKNHIPRDVASRQCLYPGIQPLFTSEYLRTEDTNINLQTAQNQHISSDCNTRPLQSTKTLDTIQPTYTDMYAYNVPHWRTQMPSLTINDNSYNASCNMHSKAHQQLSEDKMHPTHISSGSISLDETEMQSSSYNQGMDPQVSQLDQWNSVQQQVVSSNSIFDHQNDYRNLNCTVSFSPNVINHQHRPNEEHISLNEVTSAKIIPTSHAILQQHNQQTVMQQHSGNLRLTNINSVEIGNPTSQVYSCHQDSSLSLDFLEHIDSNASDLLNFDHVMHDSTDKESFELLDEMLSK